MTNSKNIPKRRFPYFEGEWEQKEFGKMCQRIQTGTTLLGCEQGKGIPLLKMGNIQRGYWDFTKLERLNQEIECENIIKYGDFLFNTRNTLELVGKGATWFIKEGLYGFNSNLARVTLDDVDTIFFNYLYNIPESIQQVKSRAVGTTSVAAIYPKDMSTIKFQLPTINEQKKLGNFFQTIDSLISLHQHKLDKLKNLKKSYLAELFPAEGERVPKRRFPGFEGEWEEKKLGDVGKTFTGLSGKTKVDFGHGNGMYVTYLNIYSNEIADLRGLDKIEIDDRQTEVKYGDVFFTTSSETPEEVGLSSVWKYDLSKVYLNSFCFGFRPNVKFDIDFLAYLLRSPAFRAGMKLLAQGISRYNISKNRVLELNILFPTLKEQEKIGKQLSLLDKSITLQQQKLDKLKDLKKAYLNELFV